MTPDEVIEKAKILNVNISRPTLIRYENQGLISTPKRGSTGRGGGRWTDYPVEVVAEVYASWALIHGTYTTDELKAIFNGNPLKVSPRITSLARLLYLSDLRMNESGQKMREAMHKGRFDKIPDEIKKEVALATAEHDEILEKIPKKATTLLEWLSHMWGDEFNKAKELLKLMP